MNPKMCTMPCARNDVVLLPFPFADQSSRKVRPAVVVGFGSHPGDIILVPLTSRLQQADLVLVNWQDCGLNVPSGIKAQIATIESDLVLSVVGRLTRQDVAALNHAIRQWLELD